MTARPTHCRHCGALQDEPGKRRSDPDHRMMWAIIQRAFENWPEGYTEFQPSSIEHLYGWLLVEARHSVSYEADILSGNVPIALLVRKLHYMRVKPLENGWVEITIPKSLSYASAGKREYEDVRSRVYELLEVILGVPIETLKREARREPA